MKVNAFGYAVSRNMKVPEKQIVQLFRGALSPGRAHVLVQRHLHHLGKIDLDQVVERVLQARKGHPVAAYRNAPAGQLAGVSITHEALHQ